MINFPLRGMRAAQDGGSTDSARVGVLAAQWRDISARLRGVAAYQPSIVYCWGLEMRPFQTRCAPTMWAFRTSD